MDPAAAAPLLALLLLLAAAGPGPGPAAGPGPGTAIPEEIAGPLRGRWHAACAAYPPAAAFSSAAVKLVGGPPGVRMDEKSLFM
jgi:hypothetical protein